MTSWKFFGEWLGKKLPSNRIFWLPKKLQNQICDKDKQLILEEERKSDVTFSSIMFWTIIIFIIVFTLNWVLG